MTLSLLMAMLAIAVPPESCDPAFRAEPQMHAFNYAAQIQPIWNQYCADCHVQHGGNPVMGLDLEPPFSRDNLVGRARSHVRRREGRADLAQVG